MAKFLLSTFGALFFLMIFETNSSIIKSANEESNDFLSNLEAEQIFKKLLDDLRHQNPGEMKRAHFWKRNDFNFLNKGDENEDSALSDSDEIKKRAHFWKRYQNFKSLKKNDENEAFTNFGNDDTRKRAHFW